MIEKIIDARTIADEVISEAIKLYMDYPQLTIFQAIVMSTGLMHEKYKDYEIVEGD